MSQGPGLSAGVSQLGWASLFISPDWEIIALGNTCECMCVHIHVHMCVSVSMHVCLCVCMSVCLCVCLWVTREKPFRTSAEADIRGLLTHIPSEAPLPLFL